LLTPETRNIYLEELRPLIGYQLDRAIGTTFSLDLLSLLMAPLAMTLFEAENKEDILKDPIAVLEALRRSADKLAIFCQQGRISIPRQDTRLYSYLENIVHDVQPEGNGVFHPKVWLLRFTAENRTTFYRFLCLTRNLTFDNSWDTVLTLEGYLAEDRVKGFSRNRPLSDFIKSLPGLVVNGVSTTVQEHIDLMSEEVKRVRFEAPPDFNEDIQFIPLGIQGYSRRNLELGEYNRLLVISPFLTENLLKELFETGSNNILITRGESLDKLNNDTIKSLQVKTDIFILDEVIERPEEEDEEKEEINEHEVEEGLITSDFSGLHAKLYIAEKGWDARVFTGSANATRAAFTGSNIEFMVSLSGKKSRIGIDPFLGGMEKTALRNMLASYHRPEAYSEPDDAVEKKMENYLESVRAMLIESKLSVSISPVDDGIYNLTIISGKISTPGALPLKGVCYPLALKKHNALEITPLLNGQSVTFNSVSITGLTGFIAFRLETSLQDKKAAIEFVLNLPVTGMPEERSKRLLQSIISDSSRFIRYLLFLLADEDSLDFKVLELTRGLVENNRTGNMVLSLPVLEEMVKAYSRNPEKIERIKKLVEDLKQTEEGQKILPPGFDLIWKAFLEVEGEVETSEYSL